MSTVEMAAEATNTVENGVESNTPPMASRATKAAESAQESTDSGDELKKLDENGMEICRFFLSNRCTQNDCKYSHSEKAKEEKLVSDKQKYKTKLCKFFSMNRCTKGEHCQYIHDPSTISPTLTQRSPTAPYSQIAMWNNQQGIAPMNKPPINNKSLTNIRNYKTQECKFFKLGQCTRDKDCTYLHDGEAPGEQEPTPELLFKLQVMNAQKQQRQREFFHRQNGMIPSPVQVPQARYDHNGMPLSIQTEMLSPGLPLSTMPYAARVMYSATPGPMNGKMTPPTFWGPNPIVSIPGPGTPTQGMQPSMYPPTPFGYLRQHNPSRRAGAPCVFFKQGKCTKGDLCMYAHIVPTEEESKSDSSNSTEAVDTNTSEEANQSEASKPEAAK